MLRFHVMNPLENMQREMEHLLRGFDLGPIVRRDHERVRFTISEQDDRYLVEAALPGIDPEKLDINVIDRQLVIKGEFARADVPNDARVHRQERRSGAFEQSLMLTDKLDTDRIEAEYKDGILSIGVPKAQAAMPKKIEVKAA
ncbi:MAG: Hsp20/alpha crystallin family protein [Pelovirga sp.]